MAQILIIEDDDALLEMLKNILEADGHQIVAFRDPAKALLHLKDPANKPPRLILTDVMMPGVDGYTLLARLQEDVRTRSIPLIVMTAKDQLRSVFEGSGNVTAFLEKPFDLAKLRQAVQKAAEARR